MPISDKKKMKALEKEFFSLYYGSDQDNERQEHKKDQITPAQVSLIRDQLITFYPNQSEADAIHSLLKMNPYVNTSSSPHEAKLPNLFLQYCQQYKFAGFSLLEIAVNEKGKKIPRGMPVWKNVDQNNFESYISPKHKAFAFVTGRVSGITVIDCDTINAYKNIVKDFPTLKDTLTVTTRKGVHLYCQYTPNVENSRESFHKYSSVDIRNDNGIVFAPPTTYDYSDNLSISYEFSNSEAEILPFPLKLIQKVKTEYQRKDGEASKNPEKQQRLIKSVEDLSVKEARQLIRLFQVYRPEILNRIPVVLNAVFDIGYQPQTYGHRFTCYYISCFEMLRIVVNHQNWSHLEEKLKIFEDVLTFDVYRTTTNSQQTYHIYCLSQGFHPNNETALQLQISFECDPMLAQDSLYNGWVIPITSQEEKDMKRVGRFGQVPVRKDLEQLLHLTKSLTQHFGEIKPQSTQHLRHELIKNFSYSTKNLTMPLFISFHSDPSAENAEEVSREDTSTPKGEDLFRRNPKTQ